VYFTAERKRPGRASDSSPPSVAEIMNARIFTSNSPIRLYVVVLTEAHGNFICIFTFSRSYSCYMALTVVLFYKT